MTRHQLAQCLIPGLLASGHFTIPQYKDEAPRLVVDEMRGAAFFPVIEEAYRLADELLALEKRDHAH